MAMKVEIEIPASYETKLEAIEEVDPTIYDQIDVAVLPTLLRLINEGYYQLEATKDGEESVIHPSMDAESTLESSQE